MVPNNNLLDSPGTAWNDSITVFGSSDSCATVSDSYVMVPANLFHSLVDGESSDLATSSEIITPMDPLLLQLALLKLWSLSHSMESSLL